MIDPRFQVQRPRSPSKLRNTASQSKSPAIVATVNPVSDAEIRACAYELYQRRDGAEDRAVEDWLWAEAYLGARKNRANKVIG